MPAKLMTDELFEAQLLRAIGYAPYRGADAGECLAVAGQISGHDLDSWHGGWSAAAARLAGQAEASAASGDAVSARNAYFRAANYFRTAGLFAMGTPLDPRLTEAHQQEVQNFRRGAALLAVPPEIVQIPYEGSFLPAYFFRAAAGQAARATVILTNGYDGTAEELYFTNGAAALERGYNVLAFDGPGQGSMIIDHGVPFRPDWENVITPVVEFLRARPDVDAERIALDRAQLRWLSRAARRHGGASPGRVRFRLRTLRPLRRHRAAPARFPGQAAAGRQPGPAAAARPPGARGDEQADRRVGDAAQSHGARPE